MTRRPFPLWPVALALGLVAFGVGLARLLALRLEAGDVYPAYSTLRADALGSKALFAALAELPDVRTERSYRPLKRLFAPPFTPGGRAVPEALSPRGTTVFFLGLSPWQWPYNFTGAELDSIEDLARRGARVVLTFGPAGDEPTTQALTGLRKEQDAARRRAEGAESGGDNEKDGKDEKDRKKPEAELPPQVLAGLHADATRRWGLDFHRVRVDSKGKAPTGHTPPPSVSLATPVGTATAETGSETLSWHSAIDLELDPRRPVEGDGASAAGWRPWLTRNRGRAVMAARSFGEGSLVLATDSFFLSNEALRDERHPALLAGLVGPQARRVVFDELHFGLRDDPGMMTLARRYRLEPALAALAALAGLFLWRSGTSLAPPRPEAAGELAGAETVAGREASAGFLALLRRSVPASALIPTCLARWEAAPARPVSEAKRARLRELAAGATPANGKGRAAGPAETYRAMAETLRRRD